MSNQILYAVKITRLDGTSFLGRLVPDDLDGNTYWALDGSSVYPVWVNTYWTLDKSSVYPVWVMTDRHWADRVAARLTGGSTIYSPRPAIGDGDKLEVVELHQ
jgi:hypothetical protein